MTTPIMVSATKVVPLKGFGTPYYCVHFAGEYLKRQMPVEVYERQFGCYREPTR